MRLKAVLAQGPSEVCISCHESYKIVQVHRLHVGLIQLVKEFFHFEIAFSLNLDEHLSIDFIPTVGREQEPFKVMQLLIDLSDSQVLCIVVWMSLDQCSEIGKVSYYEQLHGFAHKVRI